MIFESMQGPSILCVIVLLTSSAQVASGWTLFNQNCAPYKDHYNACDPFAHLSCERTRYNDYMCQCVNSDLVWSSTVAKCTLRVGAECLGPLSRSTTGGGHHYADCPPSSYCDIRGPYHKCKCYEHYTPNADGSACNHDVKLRVEINLVLCSLLVSLTSLILYV